MKKNITQLPEIKLVGISVRTSNVLEMNPATAQIGATMQRFFMDNMQAKILNGKNSGRVFAVYTDYESDEHGPYTYFLGEEVTIFDKLDNGFETLVISPQNYMKFTSNPGVMPKVVIDMWQAIWKMTESDFDGPRSYLADFEIYDERSHDSNQAVVDIYIGTR